MPDKYNPQESEQKWLTYWEQEKIFAFDPEAKGKIYSIDTPPPTVSGKMHIGHAFSYTQQDIIARYKRLRGFNVFYPFGTDDNGLPTERLVEKLKNIKASSMERSEFIKLCEETLKEIRPTFIADWKRIGMSCDFNLFYSTIDAHCRRIAQWSFLDLYKKNRIYRKDAPTMWCPECKTGISQVEVRDEEFDSTFNDIVFTVEGKELIIATTRPELLAACVAVFYHPDDERYKQYKGKKAKVPLFNFEAPILEDTRVNPEKGTGIVMCCTFGDQTDMEWQKAFDLPIKTAISPEGTMTEITGKYKGMTVKQTRKTILRDLKEAGLLKKQTPIKHAVNVHERCGTPIEFIKSKQWFVKYLDMKDDLLKWGTELKWHPDFMHHRYDNWVKGLQWDWLISNQRFFGVTFPVWYCKKCQQPILAKETQLPVDPKQDAPPVKKCASCASTQFIPETDVLNTWFTSSMTPQLCTQLLPKKYWKKLFPMSLRPQAHEIISFWLFNTVVKSRLHYEKNPWKEVALSGYVTDPLGEKMSKSKGNVVEPQEVFKKYSADALRYWAGGSKLGEDIAYQEKELIAGDKFVVKLWNAAHFTAIHLPNTNTTELQSSTETIDQWILAKLSNTITEATKAFDTHEYAKAKMLIEQFFWKDFCDNYLELVKTRLYEQKEQKQKRSAQYTLKTCLFAVLKMMAPFTPFITEELYHKYFHATDGIKSIHLTQWPETTKINNKAEAIGDIIVAILAAVRKKKTEAKLSMKAPVQKIVIETKTEITSALTDLQATTCAQEISFGTAKEEIIPGLKISVEL
ncbi:valine--tRNA ligase [Candidatus Woesearchaeota archaeon]|nr:valine--tRNA ligase [Candidatus Woesearchaeota archaeon]